MCATRLVLPLALLAGGLAFAPSAFSDGGKQANSKPAPKATKAEEPISKKESRMKQRDQEMDKRMKQQKAH